MRARTRALLGCVCGLADLSWAGRQCLALIGEGAFAPHGVSLDALQAAHPGLCRKRDVGMGIEAVHAVRLCDLPAVRDERDARVAEAPIDFLLSRGLGRCARAVIVVGGRDKEAMVNGTIRLMRFVEPFCMGVEKLREWRLGRMTLERVTEEEARRVQREYRPPPERRPRGRRPLVPLPSSSSSSSSLLFFRRRGGRERDGRQRGAGRRKVAIKRGRRFIHSSRLSL